MVTQGKSSELKVIGPGVIREWLYDRKILVMTLQNPGRDAIDAWAGEMLRILRSWPSDKRHLSLFDHSTDKMTVTPYFRERAAEVDMAANQFAENGKLALILPDSFVSQIHKLLAQQHEKQHESVQRRFFKTRQDGIEWLLDDRSD